MSFRYRIGCITAAVIIDTASAFIAILSHKPPVIHEKHGMDGADKKLIVITDGSEFKTKLKNRLLENAKGVRYSSLLSNIGLQNISQQQRALLSALYTQSRSQ